MCWLYFIPDKPRKLVGSTVVELVLPSCSGMFCIGKRVGFHSRPGHSQGQDTCPANPSHMLINAHRD